MMYVDLHTLYYYLILLGMRYITTLREFQEIIAEILECAQEYQGVSKTRVRYRVELPFTIIKEYLRYMQQCELLIYDNENNSFKSTMKGKKFLTLYREMTELLPWSRKVCAPSMEIA